MRLLLKMVVFHCYVSLPEGRLLSLLLFFYCGPKNPYLHAGHAAPFPQQVPRAAGQEKLRKGFKVRFLTEQDGTFRDDSTNISYKNIKRLLM